MTYLELIKKYGEDEVTFTHYHKCWFTFENDNGLRVISGVELDDIYKFEITNKPIKIFLIDIDYIYLNDSLIYKSL